MTQKNKLTNKNVKLYMAFMKMAGNKTAAERLGSMLDYRMSAPLRIAALPLLPVSSQPPIILGSIKDKLG